MKLEGSECLTSPPPAPEGVFFPSNLSLSASYSSCVISPLPHAAMSVCIRLKLSHRRWSGDRKRPTPLCASPLKLQQWPVQACARNSTASLLQRNQRKLPCVSSSVNRMVPQRHCACSYVVHKPHTPHWATRALTLKPQLVAQATLPQAPRT